MHLPRILGIDVTQADSRSRAVQVCVGMTQKSMTRGVLGGGAHLGSGDEPDPWGHTPCVQPLAVVTLAGGWSLGMLLSVLQGTGRHPHPHSVILSPTSMSLG